MQSEPRRLIYIWLRTLLLLLYLIYSAFGVAALVFANRIEAHFAVIPSSILLTIVLPTLLLFVILIRPSAYARLKLGCLCLVTVLRAVQWLIATILVFDGISDDLDEAELDDQTDDLLAIAGAVLCECGFFVLLCVDFYIFYVRRWYNNAVFSVHSERGLRLCVRCVSALLFASSVLWSVYCFEALGDETAYLDSWFYVLLSVFCASFLCFEFVLARHVGDKLGFVLCCVAMLFITFIWGDEQLLTFSDIATAAILPQLMVLTFAYFKKFAKECM